MNRIKTPAIRNVFFLQRAAIDVLLLNQATAIEICIYLVISKYADRNGYYSGVGYKTIKERLGIGDKKAREAIKRLIGMQYDGQRLLYQIDEWMFLETGSLPASENAGWVRGLFNSRYRQQVWLSNDLVGNNGDLINRPLHYLVTAPRTDNHARMLLLLYKYHNRKYSAVNYRFASIKTKIESSHQINGYEFHKSQLGNYHISRNIFRHLGIAITEKEAISILDDLRTSQFINVSVSAIGKYHEQEPPPIPKRKYEFKDKETRLKIVFDKIQSKIKTINSISQKPVSPDTIQKLAYATDKLKELTESYNKIKESTSYQRTDKQSEFLKMQAEEEARIQKELEMQGVDKKPVCYELVKSVPNKKDSTFQIIRKKIPSKFIPLSEDISGKSHITLEQPQKTDINTDTTSTPTAHSKFIYRLDYKSVNKRALKLDSCLATTIEELAINSELESASRKGKFYKSYWWFNPGVEAIDLFGLLTPTHTPAADPQSNHQTLQAISEMISGKHDIREQHEEIEASKTAP